MKKEVHVIDSSHEVVEKSNVSLVYNKDRGVALFKRDGERSTLHQGGVDGIKCVAVCDSLWPLWRAVCAFFFSWLRV